MFAHWITYYKIRILDRQRFLHHFYESLAHIPPPVKIKNLLT